MGALMRDLFFAPDATLSRIAKRLALMVTLMLSCLIAACAPSMTQRIKVTVTVEDNGTLYTGSAVQQWTCTETNNAMGGMSIGGCDLKAEAIPIKIGDKGWAFMLLSGNEQDGYDPEYYPGAIQAGRAKSNPKQPWSVPFDKAPIFVRFRDLKDRMTVELVRPNAFSQAFGKGVALVSIKSEPTNDWLTRGKIKKTLPWIESIRSGTFEYNSPENPNGITTQISRANFKWGL
ncbi:MAG: hypothetical protein CFE32_11025 [Alphaproteobacteria bacterium PA3]|nr:MAG: hypothetical protein CFE32_11025 [Alphaproteobacteria bacterium PA3]